MSGKKLLILERQKSNLDISTDEDGSVILEGVFTEFDVKNKNNRIYEEKEVMPHINELQEKVKTNKLLGELDHPKDFDVSLSNVSHVVESLDYDKAKKQVIGKIRLLNTSKGKEAQALIKDGIPLHISSRAAGTVDENGKVKIKKFFTYDLVADPGFENAELSRVNESFGLSNSDGILIYEMEETENNKDNKKDLTMENKNYVSVEDFQKYTEYVSGVLSNVKESTNSNNDEVMEKLIKYTEHIAEKVNQVTDYAEYLSENLDKNISYSNYLAENVNSIKDYASYLAEELDGSIQYSEHVAEMADKGIEYTNYIAENVESSIDYSEYVAEKVDQNISYSEYLGENLTKSIKYSEYIAENATAPSGEAINESLNEESFTDFGKSSGFKMDAKAKGELKKLKVNPAKMTDATDDYDKIMSYLDNKGKKIGTVSIPNPGSKSNPEFMYTVYDTDMYGKVMIGDGDSVFVEMVKESKSYKDSISEKLATLISKAETKNLSEMHFMNFLGESKKNQFNSLPIEKQAMIVESMNSKPIMSTIQAENIWESNFIEKKRGLDVISDMPEKFKEKWNNLSESRQSQIISEARFHPVGSQYGINNFWSTRDLRSTQMITESINESRTAAESANKKEPLVNESFANDLVNKMKFRLGR
jgi:hypothetical protein